MKKFTFIFYTFILIGITSCEKLFIEKDPKNNPVANFDALWKNVDEKYAFFTYKNIDWDKIYQKYRNQVGPETGDLELFDIMADMLFELKDGHVNLITGFDISRNWEWYLGYPQNFNYSIVEREYLGKDYQITGPFKHTILADDIGYIYYESFTNAFHETQLEYILAVFKNSDVKGVIVDVRDNGGGNPDNAKLFASRFTDEKVLVGYERYKTGPGHDDFSDEIPMYVEGVKEKSFTGPVVLLTNRSCFSATNDFTLRMTALPNVTQIGDVTGGGGGFPTYYELPNGWRYRFSASQTFTKDMFNVENGIAPTIKSDMDPLQEALDVDTMIEDCIDFLKK